MNSRISQTNLFPDTIHDLHDFQAAFQQQLFTLHLVLRQAILYLFDLMKVSFSPVWYVKFFFAAIVMRKGDLFCMMKTAVHSPGIYHICHTQLLNSPQPLKPGMLDQVKKKRIGNGNEPIYRVVEDFSAFKRGMPHLCSIFV